MPPLSYENYDLKGFRGIWKKFEDCILILKSQQYILMNVHMTRADVNAKAQNQIQREIDDDDTGHGNILISENLY